MRIGFYEKHAIKSANIILIQACCGIILSALIGVYKYILQLICLPGSDVCMLAVVTSEEALEESSNWTQITLTAHP